MTLSIVMHVFELFVRNIYQSKVVSTVSDLIGYNERKKSQQQQMYDEYQKYIHGILLSTVYIQTTMECCQQGAPRVLSRDISVKVLGFQRQGVSTLNCSKDAAALVSNFKRPVTEKRDEICQQSVLC